MIQFYLLSVLYLVLAAGLLLVDKYGAVLLILINIKNVFNSRKWVPFTSFLVGAVIAVGMVAFPVNPGPVVIGDLLPVLNIVVVILYFLRKMGSEQESVVEFNNGKRNALGFVTLGVAIVHFLFPEIVLL